MNVDLRSVGPSSPKEDVQPSFRLPWSPASAPSSFVGFPASGFSSGDGLGTCGDVWLIVVVPSVGVLVPNVLDGGLELPSPATAAMSAKESSDDIAAVCARLRLLT